jgi:chromosome segregation ATPase
MAKDLKIIGFQARDWDVTQDEVIKISKLAHELKLSPKVLRPELTTHVKDTVDSLKALKSLENKLQKQLENILQEQTEQMKNLTSIRDQIQNIQHRIDSLESSVRPGKGTKP